MRILKTGLFLLTFLFIFTKSSLAESSYVLPYPSAMPGSIFYTLNLIQDEILRFWYFGDFGQFHYNLKQSDKYLVEAKTLFDYKQFLLADKALNRSDSYFKKTYTVLLSAKENGKNTYEKGDILKNAALKHIEELEKIKKDTPSEFDWRPEKEEAKRLKIWDTIDNSIQIRMLVR